MQVVSEYHRPAVGRGLSTVRPFQLCQVKFLHGQECLRYSFQPFGVLGGHHLVHTLGHYLPTQPKFIFQPAALPRPRKCDILKGEIRL